MPPTLQLPIPRRSLYAPNTACAPLLGQHHFLPLATHVEAGTLGGVIAELLPPTCGSYEHLHARRTCTQSHIPFGLYGISFLSPHGHRGDGGTFDDSYRGPTGGIRALNCKECELRTVYSAATTVDLSVGNIPMPPRQVPDVKAAADLPISHNTRIVNCTCGGPRSPLTRP